MIRRILAVMVLVPVLLTAIGCGGGDPDIADFKDEWYAAINDQNYEKLYDLLDASGRRRFSTDLEQLRGLALQDQQFVIDQLGGERIESLHQLTPAQYFARLWELTTQGRRPTMSVTTTGNGLGQMVLAFDDDQKLNIDLAIEGGRWVWRLPPQEFERPKLPASPQ